MNRKPEEGKREMGNGQRCGFSGFLMSLLPFTLYLFVWLFALPSISQAYWQVAHVTVPNGAPSGMACPGGCPFGGNPGAVSGPPGNQTWFDPYAFSSGVNYPGSYPVLATIQINGDATSPMYIWID